METQVRTPQAVFMQPQRLIVPLFQRPYIWNEENQWEPLWEDVTRLAERVLRKPAEKHHPHFLGAVVLQQMPNPIGLLQARTIIDGQQRLTTLQILFDALHAQLVELSAVAPAARLEPLVANADPFCATAEDRFKVWPTNRDRAAFNAVMAAPPPVNHDALSLRGERLVEAHRYFGLQARQWLKAEGEDQIASRAAAVETVARELLHMVVIDLAVDENAQQIFETLNARGVQLTAADLIKNFIFQQLAEAGADVERAYDKHWKDFETGFWETEISVGRLRYPRSSLFLNHWLIAQTGEEVVAREVFDRFKRFTLHDARRSMAELLPSIHRVSRTYQDFILQADSGSGDRLALFGYRTGVMESEVVKPLILCLLDPDQTAIAPQQIAKTLDVVESWMVRRMLIRATTKSYAQAIAEIVTQIATSRAEAGECVERFLSTQTSEGKYWPDDAEVRRELEHLPVYKRLRRGRLRMVLEALEDYRRGWTNARDGLGGERVARGRYHIEHVMPRKWAAHWPIDGGSESEREHLIDTIGNLTLLTAKLNSKVSNGPWLGERGKLSGLQQHDVLLLNRELVKASAAEWSEEGIKVRSRDLIEAILRVWPVPHGHKSGFVTDRPRVRRKIGVTDLIAGGVLEPGIRLVPRRLAARDRVVTLLPDGQIEVDGGLFSTPSDAARFIMGHPTNGWSFFLVDVAAKRYLRNVRKDYISQMSVDDEDDEVDDENDEE